MIVADSSALCAVFFNEPEKTAFQAHQFDQRGRANPKLESLHKVASALDVAVADLLA